MGMPLAQGRDVAGSEPSLLLRRMVAIGTTLIAVYLLLLTGQRALDAYRMQRELESIRQDIIALREHNVELQRKLSSDRQELEVEQIAREQLGYARPGDHPVILMWGENPRRPAEPVVKEREQRRANWQEWLDLFVDPDVLGQ